MKSKRVLGTFNQFTETPLKIEGGWYCYKTGTYGDFVEQDTTTA